MGTDRGCTSVFVYRNPDTGVYCWFDLCDSAFDDTLPRVGEVIEVGLSMTLNTFRPQFFALEAMPILERVCDQLGLLIVDPQVEHGNAEEPVADLLVQRWIKKNSGLARYLAHRNGVPILKPYLPVAQSVEAWRFRRQRVWRLEDSGVPVVVPMVDFAMEGQIRVRRTVSWLKKEGRVLAQMFPPCDYIALITDAPSSGLIRRLHPYTSVMQALRGLLSVTDGPVGPVYFLSQDRVRDAGTVFDLLVRAKGSEPDLVSIEPDGFLDCFDPSDLTPRHELGG